MGKPRTSIHPEHWVAFGPPNALGGAADWCVIEVTDPTLIAPGRVVLCKRNTTTVHPEAARYARMAWVELGRQRARTDPVRAARWVPAALGSVWGAPVRWEQREYYSRDRYAPGGWVLIDRETGQPHHAAQHWAAKEWARFAGAPAREVAAA